MFLRIVILMKSCSECRLQLLDFQLDILHGVVIVHLHTETISVLYILHPVHLRDQPLPGVTGLDTLVVTYWLLNMVLGRDPDASDEISLATYPLTW